MFHIIDDEKHIGEMISNIMSYLGYRSKIFLCPSEYIHYTNQAEYKSPVAIFSDVRMPKMSGFEMMDTVLKTKPNLKFVMMSGYSLERKKKCNQPHHFLYKPFEVSCLIEILESLMKEHETHLSQLSTFQP